MTQNNLFRNKKELSQFINKEIYNIVKEYGYKKNAGNFYLEKEELTVLIDIQKSRYIKDNEEDFTLNWGIAFLPMSSYFYNDAIPKKPSASRCLISGRVALLGQAKLDHWWKLSFSSTKVEIDQVLQEVEYYIREYAVSFLKQLNNISDVIEMLEVTKTKSSFHGFYPTQNDPEVTQAILYLFINQKTKSLAIMDQVINDTKSDLYRDTMCELKAKIQAFDPVSYLE